MAGHSSDMPPPQYNSALMQQIHPTSPMFSPCGSVSQPQQHQQQQQQATTPQAMSATFTPHGLPTPLWSPTGVPQMLHSPLPLDPSLQSAGPPRPASTSAVNNHKLQAQSPTKRTTKLGRPPKSEAQKAADAAAKKAARKEKEPRQVRLPELLKASKKGSGNGANPKGRPPKSHQQQLQAPANPVSTPFDPKNCIYSFMSDTDVAFLCLCWYRPSRKVPSSLLSHRALSLRAIASIRSKSILLLRNRTLARVARGSMLLLLTPQAPLMLLKH